MVVDRQGVVRIDEACYPMPMSISQADLFSAPSRTGDMPSDEIVGMVRTQLRQTLRLVQSAEIMPWTDQLDIIRADNAFRYGKEALPPEEAAELWAAFNREMDRLYAVMNEGKEPDLRD
jgi:hypothetical protein